jgi:purine-binding chemotaxis protein CheW
MAADQGVIQMGLLALGELELAIPSQYLREAIPCPAHFSRLPSTSPAVVGAVDVRGELIPVLDLRPGLHLTASFEGVKRVVIVQHRERVFGIVVDALGGVLSIPASRCRAIDIVNPQGAPLMRELFSMDGGERVISVLCLDGIMNLVDVPVSVRQERAAAQASERKAQVWRPYVMFACGQTHLAMDAEVVDTVLDIDSLGATFTPSRGCLGVLQTHDRKLAVLDPLALLDLGQTSIESDRQVLVIKVGADAVGLLVRQVTRIARLDDSVSRPIPAMAFVSPHFFNGMLPVEGLGEHLKIAMPALLAMDEVRSMASIHGRAGTQPANDHATRAKGAQDATAAARRSETYLTFRLDVELAVVLKQVREILPLPAAITPIERMGDPRVGLFTHRDQVIPIVDLADLCGAPLTACGVDARLLIVDVRQGSMALLVPEVFTIEQAQWEHAPIALDQFRRGDELQLALRTRALLTLGQGTQARGVQSLDLSRIACALEAQWTPPTWQPEAANADHIAAA